MSDRMDQLISAAVRQGFFVNQTRNGTWIFSRGIATCIFNGTPRNSVEWMQMLATLRGAGLRFPPKRN